MTDPTWFDPVIFSIGSLSVRWYGLMYVLGFFLGTYLLKKCSREGVISLGVSYVDTYVTCLIVGLIVGARSIYIFIYNPSLMHEFFQVWKGGLSFHGGLLGLLLATLIFKYIYKISFLSLSDGLAIAAAPGLFFGRMGNFINAELYGRVTQSSLGIVFPGAGPLPRWPSQLFEGFLEGIVLFCILFFLRKKVKYDGILGGLFLLLYGIFRFCVEFFREPDVQLGFYFGGMFTMGQILCFLMILSGVLYLVVAFEVKSLKCVLFAESKNQSIEKEKNMKQGRVKKSRKKKGR